MNKNVPSIVLAVVLGCFICYTSYPYVDQMAENLAKRVVGEQKEMIDKSIKPEYPVGTFEYEHKRTI